MRWASSLAIVLCLSSIADAQVCQTWDGQGGRGSAVCVGMTEKEDGGIFLTAGHVVARDGTVYLAPEGRWMRGKALAWSADGPGRDFAFIELPGYKPKRTYDLGTRSPAINSRVNLCGFALGGELRVIPTEIVSHDRGYVSLSTSGAKGISGGPILSGRTVVGILTHGPVEGESGPALCTNAETIQATLKQWGLLPGGKAANQSAYIGVGMQAGCGPWGCPRPMYPVYPQPPVPQQPGFPGWGQSPVVGSPATPPVDTPPVQSPDDSELRRSVSEIKADVARIELAISALRVNGGKQGPPGEPGPQGPAGRDGAGVDQSTLDSINARIGNLESRRFPDIPVEIVDQSGRTIQSQVIVPGDASRGSLRLRIRAE